METEDSYLKPFKVISEFILELGKLYGNELKSLRLYSHLISKTKFVNKEPILKHVAIFREFCVVNKDKILNREKTFDKPVITFSEKVYIDMNEIMGLCNDEEIFKEISSYLLTLSALLDPTSKAKQVLRQVRENPVNPRTLDLGLEPDDPLGNIISKVTNVVTEDMNNPMEAFGALFSSGVIGDLFNTIGSGFQDGSLNPEKLFGSVQKLASNMNKEIANSNDPEAERAGAMLNSVMGQLNMGSPTVSEMTDEGEKELKVTSSIKEMD